jgi:hypothetical protein
MSVGEPLHVGQDGAEEVEARGIGRGGVQGDHLEVLVPAWELEGRALSTMEPVDDDNR